jgi:anti-sigma regulatory factor (Ser/Thr protein kinase)/biotin operon repressor
MAGTRQRGRLIRSYILQQLDSNSRTVVQDTAHQFKISRQAVNKHMSRLVEEGRLTAKGTTRNRQYQLSIIDQDLFATVLDARLEEHIVWQRQIAPMLSDFPRNTIDIWHYGFTEMLNNAIEHSSGAQVVVKIEITSYSSTMMILDDGYGIFKKIKDAINLDDERHSVLELAKGKLTTDPDNHTGEGIFFTSRMFDEFAIISGDVCFSHKNPSEEDWILQSDSSASGTSVHLKLANHTERSSREVFDQFTEDGDYGFTKTIVPVDLVQYGDDSLISRSQAKRLLNRFDRFRTVILDFEGVEQVGQGFADQIFRVFVRDHPKINLIPINANSQVSSMIRRTLGSSSGL